MALKAGRVGVNPKAVDRYGMPRPGDVYTKSEADAKYATKTQVNACVPKTQLKANSKDFIFAYDSTSEKYGYKAGADGDFVPFDSGASGGYGWIAPADLSHDDLTFPEGSTYISGGYYADTDNDMLYIDLVCSKLGTSGGVTVTGFPTVSGSSKLLAFTCASAQSTPDDYFTDYSSVNAFEISISGLALNSWSSIGYMRLIGMIKLSS